VPPQETLSARAWLDGYVEVTGVKIDPALAGSGNVRYRVLYAAPDGVVINKGRSAAFYPAPDGVVFKIGDEVIINRDAKPVLASAKSRIEHQR
jgi:hypothetical protein